MTSVQLFRANHRLQKHIPLLLSILLVLVMAVSLAWQGQAWRARLQPEQQTATSSTPATRAESSPEQLAGLFGASQNNRQQSAPPTNLRLTLLGSFVDANSAHSSAMIQAQGSPAQRFTVGSEVSTGVRLEAVYRDRVELSRNAHLETLAFPADTGFVGMTATPEPQPIKSPTAAFPDEQSNALADQLRALREQLDQSAAAETPSNSTTGNE